ncbi:protein YhfH [Geobacillus stearothermophilus]|nr:protein YhfH [Geobacillus stearothermophilus]MED3753485.1 protein YhfH [Geobacillus stearothermophilus]
MLMKVSEFFKKNTAPKKCSQCGKTIDEQHECYGNTCSDCLGTAYRH